MEFQPIDLPLSPLVRRYMTRYGEDSCQHSFAGMFCLKEKYADQVCEQDGRLFVCRKKRCTDGWRTYLAPMGEGSMGGAVGLLRTDARLHQARICFETVTETAKNAIMNACPGQFEAEERRDYAEYLYTVDKLANLPGSALASRRHDVRTFWRRYTERVSILNMSAESLDEVRIFQASWMHANLCPETDQQLTLENKAIAACLDNFDALEMSGIMVYVDGVLCGYACGSGLSDGAYDVMYEKGDRSIPDIYPILNMELVRRCCDHFRYINREEDLGVEGLRKAKLSYRPDILLKKYILTEVTTP